MAKTFNTGDRSGNLHKDGIYRAEIQDAEVVTAQSSGNEMVKLQLAIFKGDRQAGNTVMDFLVMAENSLWRWHQLMTAIDAPSNIDIDPETYLPGKEVWVRLVTEEWNDEDRNKVKAYMSEEKAAKSIAKESDGDVLEPVTADTTSKARSRNRASSNTPELNFEEGMPL